MRFRDLATGWSFALLPAACGNVAEGPAEPAVPELPHAAYLVKELNTNPSPDGEQRSTFPSFITALGERVYFTAFPDWGTSDERTGLYRSDGTAEGTMAVRIFGSNYPTNLVASGSHLFFLAAALEGTSDAVWVTDGAEEGTRELPVPSVPGSGMELVAHEGWVYAVEGVGGSLPTAIWKIAGDGSAVEEVYSGSVPIRPVSTPLGLHFTALEGGGSQTLFRVPDSSPTPIPQGTFPGAARGSLCSLGSAVLVATNDPSGECRVGKLQGGDLVSEAVLEGCGAFSGSCMALGARVLFTFRDEADTAQIWATDGSPAGTTRLDMDGCFAAHPSGGALCLRGGDLYLTDGTGAGALLLAAGGFSTVAGQVGDRFVLRTDSDLWMTDGTSDGTRLLWEAPPVRVGNLTVAGRTVFFPGFTDVGYELWAAPVAAFR